MRLKFHGPGELPVYATPGAAGMDVCALESCFLPVGQRNAIDTGLSCEIPEGYELQVRPRSGLAAKHGVTVLNAPGTIDSDYRGRIKVILINHGPFPYQIQRGDRIAQLVLARAEQAEIVQASANDNSQAELELTTERGGQGFGSTGR